jgi:osmotically inducible lipoprotein OsmB
MKMNKIQHKSLIILTLIALSVGTSGCGSMSTRGKSTALGAGIGAVGGAVLTGGSAVGTVGGAAVGGVVGNQVNKK